jgi:hypothetical protein
VQKHPVCGCWLSHYLENVDLKEDPYCPGCSASVKAVPVSCSLQMGTVVQAGCSASVK